MSKQPLYLSYIWKYNIDLVEAERKIVFRLTATPRPGVEPDFNDPEMEQYEECCREWQNVVSVFRESPLMGGEDRRPISCKKHIIGEINTTLGSEPVIVFEDVLHLDDDENLDYVRTELDTFRQLVASIMEAFGPSDEIRAQV